MTAALQSAVLQPAVLGSTVLQPAVLGSSVLQTAGFPDTLGPVVRLVGLGVLSFFVSTIVAIVYRWYTKDQAPTGTVLLSGVASVAIYLNTRAVLGEVAQDPTGADVFDIGSVIFYTLAFVAAGIVVPAGRRVGDRLALDTVAFSGARELDGEVSRLVKTVGRLIAVELPDDVEDVPEYDPVSDEVKEAVAGKTLLFPRGLTVAELRDRVVNRLKEDHDIGYVDIELQQDGTVEYLALGRRVAGIGPTLGPGAGAVAIKADPPNAASPGDRVQLWGTGEDGEPKRVATAELRGVAEDVVTLALDERDAAEIAGSEYRLVTLPAEPEPEREFASLLRAAEETMATVTVVAGSSIVGQQVGEIDATVAAVRPAEGSVEAIPSRSREIAVGDTIFVVARPAEIRRLEAAAETTAAAAGEEVGETDGGQENEND